MRPAVMRMLMLGALGASREEMESALRPEPPSPGVVKAYEMLSGPVRVRGKVKPGARMSAKKARRLRRAR